MADMRGTGAAQTAATDEDRFKFERRVALLAGVVVVAFVLYLAQRNQAFADPNLAIMMRIVLSLSIGIVGATIPGFLHLEYNLGGFAVRAGGALALFVLTFFGTPEVSALNLKLPDPQVSLLAPRVVDFRTEAAPTQSEDERGTAATVVTIPTGIRSTVEPARKATLSASQISFSLDATNYEFAWRYFVNMHPEQFGLWLAIQEDAHTSPIEPGGSFFREILHEPTNTAPWADSLDTTFDFRPIRTLIQWLWVGFPGFPRHFIVLPKALRRSPALAGPANPLILVGAPGIEPGTT